MTARRARRLLSQRTCAALCTPHYQCDFIETSAIYRKPPCTTTSQPRNCPSAQYRAHCDGECNGGPWREGKRIATGLVYCETADRGGDTLFTRVGLKVVPKPGQLLFFGYKLRDEGSPTGWAAAMDNGVTEHSGCPLHEGRKWIATMWFREGVSAERPWDSLRDL